MILLTEVQNKSIILMCWFATVNRNENFILYTRKYFIYKDFICDTRKYNSSLPSTQFRCAVLVSLLNHPCLHVSN